MENTSRYLIYRLLHRQVKVDLRGGRQVQGMVRRVYRDIMDGLVEVTVDGRDLEFPEPTFIRLEGQDVVFEYGRPGIEEDDNALFAEARAGGETGESLHEVLRRTAPVCSRQTRFCCQELATA